MPASKPSAQYSTRAGFRSAAIWPDCLNRARSEKSSPIVAVAANPADSATSDSHQGRVATNHRSSAQRRKIKLDWANVA